MPRPKKQKLKQRSDGRYKCKYHGIQFYGATKEEALEKREAYKRQEAAGEYKKGNPTVADYIDKWLPLHKSGVSEKCYNDYKKQLEAMKEAIGGLYLREVTVDDAASVWGHYQDYSASTVHRAKMLFVSLFDSAIENDLITKNPFRGRFAQPPKAPSGTHRTLTEAEIDLISATEHRMRLPALIMLYCGLRRGEMLALTAQDVDLTANTISITKAVRFAGNRPVIASPKTAAGTRSVPIPPIILPDVKKAVLAHPDAKERPLCPTVAGTTMTDVAFRRAWESYLLHLSKAAGKEISIRPHDLRHTYCTMLRDAGIDMHQAMIWLGHADEKMILHVYDHVTDKRTKQSIETLKNAFKGSERGSDSETQSNIIDISDKLANGT